MVFNCVSIPGENRWVESAFGNLKSKHNEVECIVKIYDNSDQFKINDLIELIGVLAFDSASDDGSEFDFV